MTRHIFPTLQKTILSVLSKVFRTIVKSLRIYFLEVCLIALGTSEPSTHIPIPNTYSYFLKWNYLNCLESGNKVQPSHSSYSNE